ncbi:RNA-binding S4 domain-containing protein [Actinomycetospora flava]|uniref:RNA-binding S4 domain-containing protein n=1 Tax=Actinomycetospora flava TaxID=3129232 RepID=A0ABU8MFJ0_9PSEU
MTDPEPETTPAATPTVLDRLLAAGLSEDRARSWIANGGARVNGEPVSDPGDPAAPPARITLHP